MRTARRETLPPSVPAHMCVPHPPPRSRPPSCLWLIIMSMHDALILCSLQISLLHRFAHLLIFLSSPPAPWTLSLILLNSPEQFPNQSTGTCH